MPTLYTVIQKPLITEKGLSVKETEGTLVFAVAPAATFPSAMKTARIRAAWTS